MLKKEKLCMLQKKQITIVQTGTLGARKKYFKLRIALQPFGSHFSYRVYVIWVDPTGIKAYG
jgi:hypothetical protein